MQKRHSKKSILSRRITVPNVARYCTAAVLASLAVAACSDDDDDDDAAPTPTAGAAGQGGETGLAGSAAHAGIGPGDTGGAGGAPDGAAGGGETAVVGGTGGAAGADDGTDRDAFRPEELPFDPEAFAALQLPDGFAINVYRASLGHARMLAVHAEHVYLTRPRQGDVLRLVDADQDGVAESQVSAAEGLPMVHGIAFHDDQVFLANVHSVFRAPVASDGSFGALTEIIDDLPDGGQHPLRTLGIGPDALLYISVGSSCDACPETNPEHATLLRSTLAGQPAASRTILARGLRNTLGFDWHPTSDELWGMDQGSDWRGDDLPPEELNRIEQGSDYGWPYCFADQVPDPIIMDPPGQTKEDYCATTTAPVLLNQAHQSPIGLVFYTASGFPTRYLDGAFVAFRGSWNRKPATGYRVAFVPFEAGEPQGIEDFVTGFLIENGTATFGRPTGIAVAPDGALLFSDDTNGIVYRVAYSP